MCPHPLVNLLRLHGWRKGPQLVDERVASALLDKEAVLDAIAEDIRAPATTSVLLAQRIRDKLTARGVVSVLVRLSDVPHDSSDAALGVVDALGEVQTVRGNVTEDVTGTKATHSLLRPEDVRDTKVDDGLLTTSTRLAHLRYAVLTLRNIHRRIL